MHQTIKNIGLIYLLCFCFTINAQFLHPTVGISSEYVGACEVATCSATYYDNGGTSGNYSNNINFIYRVFCPDSPGQSVQLTFTTFSVETNSVCTFDYLTIGNGPTQNSPVLTSVQTLTNGRLCGSPAVPFSFTSTDPSGCLTLRFRTDGSVNQPGWDANITCVPFVGGPSGNTNSDCIFATPICSASTFTYNSVGPGIVAEGCNGTSCPAGGENYSNWYKIQISNSGTLTFTISPLNPSADYDFAIYGPNTSCASLGLPIRCNDSGLTGNTGLNSTAMNTTEIVTGPSFCSQMNVIAGETYYILIDSWSPPASPVGYNIILGGTATLAPAVCITGINEKPENNWLNFSPNPASNILNYEWLGIRDDNTMLYVFDNLGRVIIKKQVKESKGSISLNEISGGVYFVSVVGKNQSTKPKKLIITK